MEPTSNRLRREEAQIGSGGRPKRNVLPLELAAILPAHLHTMRLLDVSPQVILAIQRPPARSRTVELAARDRAVNTCAGRTSARRASGHVGFMLVRVEMTLVIASSLGEDTAIFAGVASITGTDAGGAVAGVPAEMGIFGDGGSRNWPDRGLGARAGPSDGKASSSLKLGA